MEYTTEVLDRTTGELVAKSLGEFLTVTELGQKYGKGRNEIRAILHHMGLLAGEGAHGRYRLAPFAVAAGFGKRNEKSKSGYPFDTLSPLGQDVIAAAWDATVLDLENEIKQSARAASAATGLAAFCACRQRALKPQAAISWLQHFYRDLTYREMAGVLSVSEQLVGRYVDRAAEQKSRHKVSGQLLRGSIGLSPAAFNPGRLKLPKAL